MNNRTLQLGDSLPSIPGRDIVCIFHWNEADDLFTPMNRYDFLTILFRREGELCCCEFDLNHRQKEADAAMEQLGLQQAWADYGWHYDFHSCIFYPPQDAGKPVYHVSRRGDVTLQVDGLTCGKALAEWLREGENEK